MGEVFGAAKAFTAGGAAVLLQVDVLVLSQAVRPRELHLTLLALEQLKMETVP